MTIELIQAIGEYIVVPICIVVGLCASLYLIKR